MRVIRLTDRTDNTVVFINFGNVEAWSRDVGADYTRVELTSNNYYEVTETPEYITEAFVSRDSYERR